MTRRGRIWLAGALAGVGLLGTGAALLPARATLQEPLELSVDAPISETYQPLVGVDPSNRGVADLTPSGCDSVTFCDHIPLHVVVPEGLGENDNLSAIIEVSWDNPSGSNDIDVFGYDNQQIDGSGYKGVGKAATSSNPERLRIANAVLGDYNIVVRNMAGANTGYTLKARLTTEKFESPVEMLAPPPATTTTTVAESQPEESVAAVPPPTTSTTLAPVAATADDAFDFGPSTFDEALQAPEAPFGEGEEALTEPAEADEPSGLAVVMTLVVVPLLAIGALAAFMLRRRATVWA